MKCLFLDTEFSGLTQNATLLSIALVADSGETFYAVNTDFDETTTTPFVKNEVLPYLNIEQNCFDNHHFRLKGNKAEIVENLRIWIISLSEKENSIEIWADVPHYDWVLFCDLFGGALQIPKQIHYICLDLATLLYARGYDHSEKRLSFIDKNDIPIDKIIHNALVDAEVGMKILKKLKYGKSDL